jgi:hypothetical protein
MKNLRTVIIVNAFLILLFVSSNYAVWTQFNSDHDLGFSRWNPFWIQDNISGGLVNGNFIGIGASIIMPNYPFWLFFVSIAVNFYLISRLQRNKEANSIV